MADLAAEHGDDALKHACEALWRDVTERRMYVTGGFGPSEENEGFTEDYDLPNDTAYAETCASVAMVFWAARMLNLDLDGQYADVLELALYNNSLAGLSLDGEHYFYDNKLESDGTHHRWAWHRCPCCTMNVSRLVASVAGYFYGLAEREIAVHLYGGATTTLPVAGGRATLTETSNYPWDGAIRIAVEPEGADAFTLSLRVPSWCNGAAARVNGNEIAVEPERGYLKINRHWATGDVVRARPPDAPRAPLRASGRPGGRRTCRDPAWASRLLLRAARQSVWRGPHAAPGHRNTVGQVRRDNARRTCGDRRRRSRARRGLLGEGPVQDSARPGSAGANDGDSLLPLVQPRQQPDAGLAPGIAAEPESDEASSEFK